MRPDEWEQLRATLRARGVRGVGDFGRFVNNTRHFAPSTFDERAAMPVLLEALPDISDPDLVAAAVKHLRRPWARPAAFDALHAAFLRWTPAEQRTGWFIGDALATAATIKHVDTLLQLCAEPRFGVARQMIVYSLRRHKKAPGVAEVLLDLVHEPDVGLHAMSALRQVVGNAAAIPVLERVSSTHLNSALGDAATRELRKARKASAR